MQADGPAAFGQCLVSLKGSACWETRAVLCFVSMGLPRRRLKHHEEKRAASRPNESNEMLRCGFSSSILEVDSVDPAIASHSQGNFSAAQPLFKSQTPHVFPSPQLHSSQFPPSQHHLRNRRLQSTGTSQERGSPPVGGQICNK